MTESNAAKPAPPQKNRTGKPARRKDGAKKQELIYLTALGLFRSEGFEATTMRKIAKAASISLGSAYHYYPSKVAIVFDYYRRVQAQHEEIIEAELEQKGNDVATRLLLVMRTKLELVKPDRALLGHVAASVVQPGDPLSAFAPENRAVRESSIRLFEQAIHPLDLGEHQHKIATLLWVAHLGILLYLVHDGSDAQERTDRLVEQAVQRFTPLLMLATTPMAKPFLDNGMAMMDLVLPDGPVVTEGSEEDK